MAHAAGDAHEYPIYGAHFRLVFPLLDADGDLVTAASTPDSERSIDCGTIADCTNEMTEIASGSGLYYLDLTGVETTGKVIAVNAKSATAGMKTTPMVLYPRRLPILESGTAQAGAGSTITLASGASAMDNFYAGLFVFISNNGAAGSQYQARRIISYVGSTKVATVDSAWGTNPSSSSAYDILVPEGYASVQWAGGRIADPATIGYPAATVKAGTGTGELSLASGVVAASVAGAVGSVTGAVGSVTGNVGGNVTGSVGSVATGGITAASIAADAIGASELAADAATEIATAVWAAATRTLTALGFTLAAADLAADTITAAKVAADVTTEIQSGLATAANLSTMQGNVTSILAAVDTEIAAILAAVSIASGTAQSATGTTLRLAAAHTFADNELNGNWLIITGGSTGVGQVRMITGYVSATDTATVEAWATTPTGTITYTVVPGHNVSALAAAAVWANATRNLTALGFTLGASDLATDTITAAKIAADAIGASELAADAATEIATAAWASATRTLTAAPGNNISQAQVNAEVAAALATYNAATEGDVTTVGSAIAALNDITAMEVVVQLLGANRRAEAQAGGTDTITLDTGANGTNDYYNGALIVLLKGTGADVGARNSMRRIIDYTGASKVAQVDEDWDTPPDATTTFLIIGAN